MGKIRCPHEVEMSQQHERQPQARDTARRDPPVGQGNGSEAPVALNLDPNPPPATRKPNGQSSRQTDPGRRVRIWKRLKLLLATTVAVGAGVALWMIYSQPALPPGLAGGNGRLEANEIYVATKYAGRIQEILFNEGDTVDTGQVVARMD